MARPPAGIETYKAERLLWQSALTTNGLTIRTKTRNDCLQLIQRLHMFRALDRKNSFEGNYSIFDDFVVKNPGKDTTIVIERRATLESVVVLAPDGRPADLQEAQQQIDALDSPKIERFMREQGLFNPNKPLDLE